MPTQHVEPTCAELLQDVANSLLKARKVVVVTGAGISTNSGIPDFRSENGLYSLIQAQFDAASRPPAQIESAAGKEQANGESDTEDREDEPPRKRRKMSSSGSSNEYTKANGEFEMSVKVEAVHVETTVATEPTLPAYAAERASVTIESSSIAFSTPKARRMPLSLEQLMTSPLSSPPPDDAIIPPSVFRNSRLSSMAMQFSSSPLSSPPPHLFDPFCPSSPSDDGSGGRSSTSPSEVDDTPPSSLNLNPFSASQSSNSGRASLPNMKGKDLFDASIWADPLRTSVFYTFATTLRKKIRDVEPTSSHRFISHLRDRGKLVRCYTQNIDQIEEKVGLSTSLHHGPGSRGRFSRRSTATHSQLSKMVEEASSVDTKSESSESPASSQAGHQESTEDSVAPVSSSQEKAMSKTKPSKPDVPKSGVECVFLHGSLEQLRCFLCGRVCSWDDAEREHETMCGQQPECPHCAGATAAREERGKRALGVGKLRPDIVLYGEEHPNAHLISPIVTHDLAVSPDMLLILGTSLRVHGLKIMVREFAKAVHAKGGKVVFVNFTKPPESSWGDIIDYWIQWDCDAWVSDLQGRIPKLWLPPEPPKTKKKRDSAATLEDGSNKNNVESKRPPPANPVALRDTKVTGAYQTLKIVDELHRITGEPDRPRRASLSTGTGTGTTTATDKTQSRIGDGTLETAGRQPRTTRPRGPRKSAPGKLERSMKLGSSTLNPDHGRPQRKSAEDVPAQQPVGTPASVTPSRNKAATGNTTTAEQMHSSILDSVKKNARTRKRKKIDGIEVRLPTVNSRRSPATITSGSASAAMASQSSASPSPLGLAPMLPPSQRVQQPSTKLQTLEPRSPPPGPLASISPNMRSAKMFGMAHSFYMSDPLVNHGPTKPMLHYGPGKLQQLASDDILGQENTAPRRSTGLCSMRAPNTRAAEGKRLSSGQGDDGVTTRSSQKLLARWGSSWNCAQQ